VPTAFVLSGGASLGAVQVGMLRALVEREIAPDLLVGTSAGALNAAFISGHGATVPGVRALEAVWGRLQTRMLFPVSPRHALHALAGHRGALCSDRGLRHLLDRYLTFDVLENAPIPLVVVATDLLTGREVPLQTGDARRAVLASCAIPGIFPTVEHEGMALVDGGLANNTAISQAVAAGAEKIYVLPSGYPCALSEPPRSPLGAVTQALAILMHQRLVADVARYADDEVDLIVLPPPCPLDTSPANFGRAHKLIGAAYECAVASLSVNNLRRRRPEHDIAVHSHPFAQLDDTARQDQPMQQKPSGGIF
jgi:NTE family protein